MDQESGSFDHKYSENDHQTLHPLHTAIPLGVNNHASHNFEESTLVSAESPSATPQELNPYYERVKTIFIALRQFANLAFPEEKHHRFNPRITRQELKSFQDELGYQVPDQFVAVYARHNGHDPQHPIQYVYGGEFLSVQRIVEVMQQWRDYMAGITVENDPCRDLPSDRVNGVRQQSWNDLWLPFAISADKEEYLCLDLDPNSACGGVFGQVISVSWYATPRQYVCTDLLTFFEYLTEKLLHGDIDLHHRAEDSWGNVCSMM